MKSIMKHDYKHTKISRLKKVDRFMYWKGYRTTDPHALMMDVN